MAGKRETNPAGSTNTFRDGVLRVLGALKVATADQIQRIGAPHLSYRHTAKPTPSKRKQARTASHTAALSDTRGHGLVENGGSTQAGDRLRNLTPKGLQAASYELQRPVSEMSSTARGAGSSGVSHPMAVNETVIAMLRPKPDLAKLAQEPADVQAAVDAPPGIGTIASYWTEVPLQAGVAGPPEGGYGHLQALGGLSRVVLGSRRLASWTCNARTAPAYAKEDSPARLPPTSRTGPPWRAGRRPDHEADHPRRDPDHSSGRSGSEVTPHCRRP
ncbi:hypothetical protein QWJ26_03060 [Streptomyces sp. CSDS2]|uniref:hypothetical protein n=1 Tax=Streptomyces sp. CSDS2 TaxID=3055051 RepID=UPI0025AF19DC|nr:hypothetical protein [Streptomyces sp. CSDS2]MDN3258796.1 hypothetical protein [Streptomyces sp. CSDS2]